MLSALARAPLKELVIDECKNLQSQSLVNGHLILKSLSRLSLNSFTNLTSSDVMRITGAVPRLCSLSMEEYFPLFSYTTLKALDQLHDLFSLNLQLNPAVNDQIMNVVTGRCHMIEELDITLTQIWLQVVMPNFKPCIPYLFTVFFPVFKIIFIYLCIALPTLSVS